MKRYIVLLGMIASVWWSQSAMAGQSAHITGDRVNLRAAPRAVAEVVGQMNDGDTVVVVSQQTNWVEVLAPESFDVWIYRDFVKDGEVTTKKLNIRSGPGINYHVVGRAYRHDQVDIREEFGEWYKVAPTEECTFWISSDYVTLDVPEQAAGVGAPIASSRLYRRGDVLTSVADIRPAVQAEPVVEQPQPLQRVAAPVLIQQPKPQVRSSTPIPSDWKLIPLEGQGKRVERQGVVKSLGFTINRPTRYRLVAYRDGSRAEMVCYLWGNDDKLAAIAGRTVRITGQQYWLQDQRYPVLTVDAVDDVTDQAF